MSGLSWWTDVPPWNPPFTVWHYSGDAGATYSATYQGQNFSQVAGPTGQQRFRQSVVVPAGITEPALIVSYCGDLFEGGTNVPPEVRVDGVLAGSGYDMGASRCGLVAVPMALLPAGPHNVEIWVGTSLAAGGATLTRLDSASAYFPLHGSNSRFGCGGPT